MAVEYESYLLQVTEVGIIHRTGQLVWHQSLLREVDAKEVDSLGDKGIDGGQIGPGVVLV